MYPFDTSRGRLALGIAIASGGGMLISYLMQQNKDPKHHQTLQLVLVFWLIFVFKTTLAYMRDVGSSEAQPAVARQRGGKGAAPPLPAEPADSTDTQEAPVRRRRTRRD